MMECAGNDKYSGFRLMSAAKWEEVTFEKLFSDDNPMLGFSKIDKKATHVLITGFDDDKESGGRAGGWKVLVGFFHYEELIEQQAFIATKMNGKKLDPDLRVTLTGNYTKNKYIDSAAVEMPKRDNLLSWTHWSYWWEPTRTGKYIIDMSLENPNIQTRRLDKRYYEQAVRIKEI